MLTHTLHVINTFLKMRNSICCRVSVEYNLSLSKSLYNGCVILESNDKSLYLGMKMMETAYRLSAYISKNVLLPIFFPKKIT